jgi:histidine triad (HIT) family protein
VVKCIFCDIISGSVPAAIVLDEPQVVAFLDHQPLFPGHVLVAPRAHRATLADVPDDELQPYFVAVKRIASAVERAMQADGTFIAINIKISQSVPHLHTHVVPRRKGDGLFGRTFQWIRHRYPTEAAMRDAQQAIVAALCQ